MYYLNEDELFFNRFPVHIQVADELNAEDAVETTKNKFFLIFRVLHIEPFFQVRFSHWYCKHAVLDVFRMELVRIPKRKAPQSLISGKQVVVNQYCRKDRYVSADTLHSIQAEVIHERVDLGWG